MLISEYAPYTIGGKGLRQAQAERNHPLEVTPVVVSPSTSSGQARRTTSSGQVRWNIGVRAFDKLRPNGTIRSW